MKTVFAIICSIVLVAAQMLMAQPSANCSPQPVRACCHHCDGKMACCAAQPVSNSKSVPANSARPGAQNDFSLLFPASLTAVMPVAEASPQFSPASPLTAAGAPLYARHCARLI
jgi:hypothetical protein